MKRVRAKGRSRRVITLWEACDRTGLKWFTAKPTYSSGFDVFDGPRTKDPKGWSGYRVIRRFKARVTGAMVGRFGYATHIQVG